MEGYNFFSDKSLRICLPKEGFQLKNCKFGDSTYVVPDFVDSEDFLIAGIINEDTKQLTKKLIKKSPVDSYTPRPQGKVPNII